MNLLALDRDIADVVGVKVRSLTAGEQIDLEAVIKAADGDVRKIIAAQLVAYVCDDAGKACLSAEDAAKAIELQKPATMKAIIEAAGKLNGWGESETIRGN